MVYPLSFIGISSSLPTTSYVKMIDVWMIFTMVVPLLEVAVHTYKETIRKRLASLDLLYPKASTAEFTKVRAIPSSRPDTLGQVQAAVRGSLGTKLRLCHTVLDLHLPIGAAVFTTVFCLVGLIVHFSPTPDNSHCSDE